jgi:hypothetical protein
MLRLWENPSSETMSGPLEQLSKADLIALIRKMQSSTAVVDSVTSSTTQSATMNNNNNNNNYTSTSISISTSSMNVAGGGMESNMSQQLSAKSAKSKKRADKAFSMDKYSVRHIALRVAYLGWNYHGLVRQLDTEETIEVRFFCIHLVAHSLCVIVWFIATNIRITKRNTWCERCCEVD